MIDAGNYVLGEGTFLFPYTISVSSDVLIQGTSSMCFIGTPCHPGVS